MRYAIVVNGNVENIIIAEIESSSKIAQSFGGEAINIEDYPVEIGHTYVDGVFYDNNNNKCEKIQTISEIIVTQEIENIKNANLTDKNSVDAFQERLNNLLTDKLISKKQHLELVTLLETKKLREEI